MEAPLQSRSTRIEHEGGGRGPSDWVQQQQQSVGRLVAYLGEGFLLFMGDGSAEGYGARGGGDAPEWAAA